MKNILRCILITISVSLLYAGCKNPLDDIEVNVNAQVIRYSALFELTEPLGTVPTGLTVAIAGPDKDAVYDLGGKKAISIDNNGIISLGLDPRMEPKTSEPVEFNVIITGPGYIGVNIPVKMVKNQLQQIHDVSIMKLSAPPAGAAVEEETVALVGGAIATPIAVATPVTNGATETTALTLASGTVFKDESGATITGGSVAVSMATFGINTEESIKLFPGGSLTASDVTTANNQTTSLTFLPAAFANVEMRVGTSNVRQFNQPVNITMGISPSYQNTVTNAPVKAGDVLGVYSYQLETGLWRFETNTTVISANGQLKVAFPTSHLTWFMVGQAVAACNQGLKVNFNASWLGSAAHPVTVEVKIKGVDTYKLYSADFSLSDKKAEFINSLPDKVLSFKVYNNADGQLLAAADINNPCGNEVTIDVNQPGTINPEVFMKLSVRCPARGVITPPDFFFYYKTAGVNEPYQPLGLVTGGEIRTRVLQVGPAYDFKAVWGSRTKVVYNKTVNLTNQMEVSDTNYGQSPGNLPILIQECL